MAACNLQAENNTDLEEIFERSRHDWLDSQDIRTIFGLREELPLSTKPVSPFDQGLYLYKKNDQMDDVEWDTFNGGNIDHHKAFKGNNPIRYTIARCSLNPVDVGKTTTHERRVYRVDRHVKICLAHYLTHHIVGRLEDTDESTENYSSGDGNDGENSERNEDYGAIGDREEDDLGDALSMTDEKELASLWEKMKRRGIRKNDRSKLISEALRKMKGKIPEIAGSHVSSRILQTCVNYCSQAEKEALFTELQLHFLYLASNTYAVHLLKNMLDRASKEQLAACISSLRGHVAPLLRHMVGSIVVEHAYQLGTAAQKQALLAELYSAELQLFKDLTSSTETRVVDIIAKLGLQEGAVIGHMTATVQPILEKEIVDHTIIHKFLIEYLSIADKTSAADVIQHLTGPLLLRMVHTCDGSRLAMLCIKHGSAKEKDIFVKAMKSHVGKMASDQFGSMVLAYIFSVVDDTKLVTEIIVRELEATLKDLVMEKNSRRPLLQLLQPNCSDYFSTDDLASFDLYVPSLCLMDKTETSSQTKDSDGKESDEEAMDEDDTVTENTDHEENVAVAGVKKDPLLRRQELLINSGLAGRLIDVCMENSEEFLKSNFGKEVMYEVAMGGADGIICSRLNEKLHELYEAITTVAAKPKQEEPEENSEHILENFHSSQTIRRLVLECPAFASSLFTKALSGKCRSWAQGQSSKIISAFLETQDSQVREMAKEELQVLVEEGALKLPETKKPE